MKFIQINCANGDKVTIPVNMVVLVELKECAIIVYGKFEVPIEIDQVSVVKNAMGAYKQVDNSGHHSQGNPIDGGYFPLNPPPPIFVNRVVSVEGYNTPKGGK